MEFQKEQVLAVLIVFFAALGVWHFPEKSTLPQFSAATQIYNSLQGESAPFYIQAAASAESLFAAVSGTPASSPETIAAFLLVFPSIALGLAAVLLYFSLLSLGFGTRISVFSSILFAFSLVSLSFLPGVYSSAQLAALFFSAFLFFFCRFIKTNNILQLAICIIFAALASFTNAAFALAGMAVAIAFAVPDFKGKREKIAGFAIVFIAFAAGAFFSSEALPFFSIQTLQSSLVLVPFLLAAASVCAAFFFFSGSRIEYLLLFAAGIIVSGFLPLAGALLLVLAAAEGISKACSSNLPKSAYLIGSYLLSFFAIAGIASLAAQAQQALAIAAVTAVLAPLVMHFYSLNAKFFFPLLALAIVSFSLFFSVFYQLPPQKEFYPVYAGKDLTDALLSLSNEKVQSLSMLDRQDAAGFYIPSAKFNSEQGFSSYLISGKPNLKAQSHAIVSASEIDGMSSADTGFETYAYAGNYTNQEAEFAFFVSKSGRIVSREIAVDGSFALSDGVALDSFGRAYASIPIPSMIMLSSEKAYWEKGNRLVVLGSGTVPPHFISIYAGEDSSMELVSEFGDVSVYRVE